MTPIAYVQNAVFEGGTGITSPVTTAAFGSSNVAGNSIIVVLAAGVATGLTFTGVTDTQGNKYVNIIPQYIDSAAGNTSISMYWCSSVIGGSGNQVIGSWTGGTSDFPAIYAIEYSGLLYFDVGSANAANGTQSDMASSGNFTTTQVGVIVSANIVGNVVSGPGINYVQRLITGNFGDIIEDWIGAPVGINNATAPLVGGNQDWAAIAGNFGVVPGLLPTPSLRVPARRRILTNRKLA